MSDRLGESWRVRLARRLAALSAALTTLVLVPLALGTVDPVRRTTMLSVTVGMVAVLMWAARRTTPQRIRAITVVIAFVAVPLTGYATVGLLSAPAAGFAAATVVSGLLLGRRAMVLTIAVVSVAVAFTGTMMVAGVITPPPIADISPDRAQPWLRSVTLTVILVVIIGAAVTWAVETIELSARRADAEAKRRRHAEAKALEAQSRELIGQLSAGLAHDVNNQLTVVRGWSALLAHDATATDRDQAIGAIGAAVNRTSALIQQLLVLGRRDLRAPREMSLRDFVCAEQRTLQQLLPDDIDIVVDTDADVWCLLDEAQAHQILLNLAINARDAIDHRGSITLRVRSREIDAPEPAVGGPIPPGRWAALEVEDDGAGMDEETQRRAFEPFFSTKADGKGTGLGLPMLSEMVAASGGHVQLASEVGRGTRVTVLLPQCRARAASSDSPVDALPTLQGCRILLVEDDDAVRHIARRALELSGATVQMAADGDEALVHVQDGSFDVLCTDAVMPGVPVAQVIGAFRAKSPERRVLVCSAHVREELVRRGIEEGDVDFLPKPYEPATLVQRVGATWRDTAAPTA